MAQNDSIYDNLYLLEQIFHMTSRRTSNFTRFDLCINIEAKARTSYDYFII